jgi:hypothetical protein
MKILIAFITLLGIQTANAQLSITPEHIGQNEVQTLDYSSYYFGRVLTNSYNRVLYTVTNTGDEPLDFQSASIWGMYFDARHSCAKGLQPKEKCRFEITYWPAFRGYHSGEFELAFKQDSIIVHVWGDAIERY